LSKENSEGLLIKNHDPDRESIKNSMSEGQASIEARKIGENKKAPEGALFNSNHKCVSTLVTKETIIVHGFPFWIVVLVCSGLLPVAPK
jgi:hypothetical protein